MGSVREDKTDRGAPVVFARRVHHHHGSSGRAQIERALADALPEAVVRTWGRLELWRPRWTRIRQERMMEADHADTCGLLHEDSARVIVAAGAKVRSEQIRNRMRVQKKPAWTQVRVITRLMHNELRGEAYRLSSSSQTDRTGGRCARARIGCTPKSSRPVAGSRLAAQRRPHCPWPIVNAWESEDDVQRNAVAADVAHASSSARGGAAAAADAPTTSTTRSPGWNACAASSESSAGGSIESARFSAETNRSSESSASKLSTRTRRSGTDASP